MRVFKQSVIAIWSQRRNGFDGNLRFPSIDESCSSVEYLFIWTL